MNITTCHRRLLDDVKRKTQTDSNQAMMAIIDAMEFYKYREFNFNKDWQQVFLPKDGNTLVAPIAPIGIPVTRPGIPAGLIRPAVVQIVGLVTGGDVNLGTNITYQQISTDPLIEVDASEIWRLLGGTGQLSEPWRGMPTHYAWIDGPLRAIRVYPAPNQDMVADVYGSIDAHRPRYSWQTDNWLFEQLFAIVGIDTHFWQWQPMSPDFTNVWLDNAEQMIRAWARHYLYSNFYGDQKMSQVAAGLLAREEDRMLIEKVAGFGGNLSLKPSSL